MTQARSTRLDDREPDSGLRQWRRQLGLRHRDLARRAAVSETSLRKWERGLELPSRAEAVRLAGVLGVTPGRLASAQRQLMQRVTPGEGYATARAGDGHVTAARRPPPASKRPVVDLFCGAGGLSFGFEQSGRFSATCGIDLLPDRIETFVRNHAHARGIAGDLLSLSLDDLARELGPVDVVLGGPPCQGFSSIRPFRTLTEGDRRNSLVEHYVLAIAKLRPRWFVFENVVGLLTHERGERLGALLEGLSAAGYRVDWRVIDVALLGVPQHRERVVVVGNREGLAFAWPEPTHEAKHRSMAGSRPEVLSARPGRGARLAPALSVMDAISDLPEVAAGEEARAYAAPPQNAYQRALRRGCRELTLHRATRHSERMLEIVRQAGDNISALPEGLVSSGFSSCYSRLRAAEPSTTLTVNFVHPASNRCIHPVQHRALTPREGARLQSFPDRFEFCGTAAQIVKQIGNAVPPRLGTALARAILRSERLGRSESSGAVAERFQAARREACAERT